MALNLSKLAAAFAPSVDTAVSFMRPEVVDPDFMESMEESASEGEPWMVGARLVKQSTQETCGATALLAALMLTYPGLREDLEDSPDRLEELELDLYEDLRSDAIAGRSWPSTLGTPPWTLARELSDDVIRYWHTPIDDSSDSGWNALQWAYHATTQGHPVPLYVGDSLAGDRLAGDRLADNGEHPGSVAQSASSIVSRTKRAIAQMKRAVPRHVVLAIPGEPYGEAMPQMRIFDPATGNIHAVPLLAMANRSRPLAAFGGWTHVVWAVLPRPAQS